MSTSVDPRHRRLYVATTALIAIDLFLGTLALAPIKVQILDGTYITGFSRPIFEDSGGSTSGSIQLLAANVTVEIPPLPLAQRVHLDNDVKLIQKGAIAANGRLGTLPKTLYILPLRRSLLTGRIEVVSSPGQPPPKIDLAAPVTIEITGHASTRAFTARGVLRGAGSR